MHPYSISTVIGTMLNRGSTEFCFKALDPEVLPPKMTRKSETNLRIYASKQSKVFVFYNEYWTFNF